MVIWQATYNPAKYWQFEVPGTDTYQPYTTLAYLSSPKTFGTLQHSHNQANERRPSNMPSSFPLSKRGPDLMECLAGVWGCVKRYYVPIPVQRRPELQTRYHARQFVSYNPPPYDEVPAFLGPPADGELPTYGEVILDAAPPAYYVA